MEAIAVLVMCLILVLPLIALAVSLVALSRVRALKREQQVYWIELRAWAEQFRGAGSQRAAESAPVEESPAAEGPVPEAAAEPEIVLSPAPRIQPQPESEFVLEFDGETPVATAPAPFEEAQPPAEPAAEQPLEREKVSLEERLGARLPIWFGAAALACAGIFLVHYSIQNSLVTPAMRVAIGLFSGLVCVGLGEWLARRNERIAQGLSAAGIAVLFSALLAGISLYQLINPVLGFALVAITTLAAVALSLRRGPIVALVGLLGGFLSPALIGVADPQPAPLFSFFFVLQAALFFVVRKRGWWPLALIASAVSFLWAGAWILGDLPGNTDVLGLFLLASLAGLVVLARSVGSDQQIAAGGLVIPWHWVGWAGSAASSVLLAALAARMDFGTHEGIFLGILGAGALLLGRLDPKYRVLPWITGGATLLLLAAWGMVDLLDGDSTRFLATLALSGGLYTVGAYAAHFRTSEAQWWAGLASLSTLAHFLIALGSVPDTMGDHGWGLVALLLSALLAAASLPRLLRRDGEPHSESAISVFLAGSAVLFGLAALVALEPASITVAWAFEVVALVWLAGRLRVPVLAKLSGSLSVFVLARLVLNPAVLDYALSERFFFGTLHYLYGLPILALAAASWLARAQKDEKEVTWLTQTGAVILGWAYLSLIISHAFHGADLLEGATTLAELGCYGVVWPLYGAGLYSLGQRNSRSSLCTTGQGIFLGGIAFTILIPGLFVNPLWNVLHVGGTPVFNAILLAFLLPACLAGLGIRSLGIQGKRLTLALAAATLWLGFLALSLEIRHAFHGRFLSGGATTLPELYSYSAGWVLFGMALLAFGIWRHSPMLRFSSLAVILVVVLKVFLFDFSHLEGLYRVFSFLGLGVSLMLLAFLYQRFGLGRKE